MIDRPAGTRRIYRVAPQWVAADQGWPLYLQRFADLVTGGS